MSFKKVKRIVDTVKENARPGSTTSTSQKAAMTLSDNRDGAAEIREILKGIPFHKNLIHNPEDPDFFQTMKDMRDGFLVVLNDADPIEQDISAIDKKLQLAANAWSSAVTEGYYNKAKWSIAALTKGIKNFRTSIPKDKEDRVAAVLNDRLEQLDVYISLIKNAEAIDEAKKSIINTTIQLNESTAKLAPIQAEIRAARTDPAKLKMQAKIKAVQLGRIKADQLTDEEVQFRDRLSEGVTLVRSIKMQRNNIEKAKLDLTSANNMFAASRTRLTLSGHKDTEELVAIYKKVMNDLVSATQDSLIHADRVRQEYLVYQKEMDALWDTIEGQNALAGIIELIEYTNKGTNDQAVMDIAVGMKEALNEEDSKNQQIDDRLSELFQEASNNNYNYNT